MGAAPDLEGQEADAPSQLEFQGDLGGGGGVHIIVVGRSGIGMTCL